jgi:DnaJ domain
LVPFDATKDYYAIIGASEDASPQDIDRSYKRQAHVRHPDRGGTEEEMKALNEAYGILKDHVTRRKYDSMRARPGSVAAARVVNAPAREVGVYGQALSALLCLMLGLMLLFLVRFNGLFFLWPLAILAAGVIGFGVLIAHSAMANARALVAESHPARRFRMAQEIAFWTVVGGAGYAVYLILTTI